VSKTPRPAVAAHRWGPEARRRTEAARARLLGGSPDGLRDGTVRAEIATSWRRSQLNGVDPGARLALPHDPDREMTPRLLRAATPVLERLSEHLDNTAIVLADSSSWLLWRAAADPRLLAGLDRISAAPGSLLAEDVAGTNGLGTVLELRAPVIVAGPEHYSEEMQDFTCVGVPVRDPLTMRLEGIIALTCHYRDTNEHLLPLVSEAAKEVEARLFEGSSMRERALFDAFVRMARSPALAVASMNDEFLFTNAQAALLFDPADHALLWNWAKESLRYSRTVTGRLVLSRGDSVDVRCAAVEDGSVSAGVLLTMRPTRAAETGPPSPTDRCGHPMPVWQGLVEDGRRLFRARRRVAVLGEPGVGKATFARALHAGLGDDADPPVEVDLAVDPLAALAGPARDAGATVLLRHVECLPRCDLLALPSHLARAAARVLVTADPSRLDAALLGRIVDRTDGVFTVPALRDRRRDLPGLAAALLAELHGGARPPRCDADVTAALMRHELPGNAAELRRVLSTALAAADRHHVALDDLPAAYRSVSREGRRLIALEEAERATIVDALRQAGWNANAAAVALGISRATIYRKMKSLRIRRPVRG
jgi:sigma-54 dependent transcriptional regulator, acetoin dehydrogenase operon transcriptional activator AcoR